MGLLARSLPLNANERRWRAWKPREAPVRQLLLIYSCRGPCLLKIRVEDRTRTQPSNTFYRGRQCWIKALDEPGVWVKVAPDHRSRSSLQIIASGVRVNLANSCEDSPTIARLGADNFLNTNHLPILMKLRFFEASYGSLDVLVCRKS
jgi:hypothetical protein